MGTNQLAFTPVVVELKDGKKLCIAESDVESYPGMFGSQCRISLIL